MKESFKQWYEPRRLQYRTASYGMEIPQYVEAMFSDMSNAFMDYLEEVVKQDVAQREEAAFNRGRDFEHDQSRGLD